MFDLKQPCVNCPFRKGQGEKFSLTVERLNEIKDAVAFQCHKTVNYDSESRAGRAGDHPQQCAGLMAILMREGKPNQIMQVAQRLTNIDFSDLDPKREAYENWEEVLKAHSAHSNNSLKKLKMYLTLLGEGS